jgi:large subunit ribosomal protein L20
MGRVTSVPASKARRKKELKLAKGFYGRNNRLNRVTSGVVKRSLRNQFVGRKQRKRQIRELWVTRIGIAAKNADFTYSSFIHGLKKAQVLLNRKILSELAISDMDTFSSLVKLSQDALNTRTP